MDNLAVQDFNDLNYGSEVSGDYSRQDLEMLYKAMSAGAITGRETNNLLDASGAPLKVESLENTMKILTSSPKHTPFFVEMVKKPATNTIEEYNQLVSLGNFDGGFTEEGELPEAVDSIYRRKAQKVKYFGMTGGVTLPMQLVTTGSGISNMIAAEVKNKAQKLLELMERYVGFADERIIPQHFNGLLTQHETESGYPTLSSYYSSDIVVDCGGSVLTTEHIEHGVATSLENLGLADTLIGPPAVFSNFVTRYHSNTRILPVPQMVRDGVFGQRVNEIITQNGGVRILQSNFFRNGLPRIATQPASSPKAPTAPTTVTASAVNSSFSKIRTSEIGDYYYGVTAVNRFGESPLTLVSAIVSPIAGQAVDLTITPSVGSAYAPTGFNIYKTVVDAPNNAVKFYKVLSVPVASLATGFDGGAAGVVRDNFYHMPATDQAWMPEWDGDQVFAFKQLAPMMKVNLAVTGQISRFMVLLYGTPILYAPMKTIRFINIGRTLPS